MSSIPDNCCPGENDPKAPASKAAPSEIPASLKSKGIEPFTYRGRAAMGAKPSTARVTVVRAIGFQRTGKNPSMFESRYTCNSPDPGVDPEKTELVIGPEWTSINPQGLDACMLLISNDEGRSFEVWPTPEEKADIEARVIEIGIGDNPIGMIPVYPSREETFSLVNGAAAQLKARCISPKQDSARCTVILVPGSLSAPVSLPHQILKPAVQPPVKA